jgi:hypothetical protein
MWSELEVTMSNKKASGGLNITWPFWPSQKKPNVYSHEITLLNAFVPAILHVATSSLIFVITMFAVEGLFRKTRAVRSFHISHDIIIAREAMAFLLFLCL